MSTKQQISSPNAPAAIGPYSQAIRAGSMIFCSGQIPLDPKTMQVVGNDVATQTRQVLKNIKAVLDAAGARADQIVKTTVFLKNMGDFAAFNEVYQGFFNDEGVSVAPARSTVEVSELPKSVLVEIESIVAF
ncbi:MAG TPA: RidA family protein [Bdellovibrionota bacterium]|jgi:2-iminobutanoate/2-iminopropanoate deaminase|nr:RidA family protein [Bdellovibrionota bacterium]